LNASVNQKYAQAIREAAQQNYAGGLVSGALYSRIVWFHKYRSLQGDTDNIAKRIHDALKGVVFADDGLITHTMAMRIDATVQVEIVPDAGYPSAAVDLVQSLGDPGIRDILYVEVGHQTESKVYLGPIS
jgi:hypothetical protein